ncbi:MAG: FAD-dependent oxidoreductase [Armatimonadetes bacterium]|nr:FAD-dependent oxidoreductase [Armatimonadota bacterium]
MDTLVLGAGLAGLGAARTLQSCGVPFGVIEADSMAGGLAQTAAVAGFSFDKTGHYLHFKSPDVERLMRMQGVALRQITRRAAVLLEDVIAPYPLQFNLWALKEPLKQRILDELESAPTADLEGAPASLAEAAYAYWGRTLTELFFRPYNEKLWARPLEDLPADCLGDYVPRMDRELVRQGSKSPVQDYGYNATFFYPESGRMGDLMDALASPVGDKIRFGSSVREIDTRANACILSSGKTLRYQRLISSIPLPQLLKFAGISDVPSDLLSFTKLANIRIGFRGRLRCPYHWVYISDPTLPIHRIGFPCNVDPGTCPEGCASLSIEYTRPPEAQPLSAETLAHLTLRYLLRRGMIEVEELLFVDEILLSPAYVLYRSKGREKFKEWREELERWGILVAGRFGVWDYFSMEQAFQSGCDAALQCVHRDPMRLPSARGAS